MRVKMWPRHRDTGNVWTIVDQQLNPQSVGFTDDGQVKVKVKIDQLRTSGDFEGEMSVSIHELYYILGAAEQNRAKRQKDKIENIQKRLAKLEPDNPLKALFGELIRDGI